MRARSRAEICRSVLASTFHFGHSALVNDEGKSVMIRPWYRQFYLRRGDAEWYSDRISDHGYTSGLEAVDGFAYVGTTMYGSPTEVVIEVRQDDPGIPESADRSAEAVLRATAISPS